MHGDGGDHAEQVARAADAWITDPHDVIAYQHLVDAVRRWRAHTRPMLEGTESAGRRVRRMDPQLDLPLASPQQGAASDDTTATARHPDAVEPAPEGRAPASLGAVLGDLAAQLGIPRQDAPPT